MRIGSPRFASYSSHNYVYAWNGNNVYVSHKNGRWKERERYQLDAIMKCNELLALINIARRLFHLKGKKVKYWSELTISTRKMISAWHEANKKMWDVG